VYQIQRDSIVPFALRSAKQTQLDQKVQFILPNQRLEGPESRGRRMDIEAVPSAAKKQSPTENFVVR
jgi:hypothetical protein